MARLNGSSDVSRHTWTVRHQTQNELVTLFHSQCRPSLDRLLAPGTRGCEKQIDLTRNGSKILQDAAIHAGTHERRVPHVPAQRGVPCSILVRSPKRLRTLSEKQTSAERPLRWIRFDTTKSQTQLYSWGWRSLLAPNAFSVVALFKRTFDWSRGFRYSIGSNITQGEHYALQNSI